MKTYEPRDGEKFLTVRSAAKALNLKYHALLRAVNQGLIPSYQPFNPRRLVVLEEVETFVCALRIEGQDDE